MALYSALFFFCYSCFSKPKLSSSGSRLELRHWLFAITTIFYSSSLAHYPRFFVPGLEASVLHTILRATFAITLFLIAAEKRLSRAFGIVSYVGLISCYLIGGFFYPGDFESLYEKTLPMFNVLTIVALWDTFQSKRVTRMTCFLRVILASWIFVQLDDLVVFHLNFGAHLAPSIVTATVLAILMAERFESKFERAVPMINGEVHRIASSASPIEYKLREIGPALQAHSPFSRVSIYADAYALGLNDRPFERLVRIYERGYSKNTIPDREIEFVGHRGVHMKSALVAQKPVLKRGQMTNAWFCNIPVGKHAILNLSDANEGSSILAHEAYDLVERIFPALHIFSSRTCRIWCAHGLSIGATTLASG